MGIILALCVGIIINLVFVIPYMVMYDEAPSYAELVLIPYSLAFLFGAFMVYDLLENIKYKNNDR